MTKQGHSIIFNEKFLGENMVSWYLNNACNFNCEHCFSSRDKKEHPDCGKYSPNYIAKCFDNTGTDWIIHMSGGEPFLYKDFLELCQHLTINHYISFNTNLSTSNVKNFADIINPDRVLFINAAVHIVEREKSTTGIQNYINNLIYFQDKGFNIFASYVCYPLLFPRIENDFEMLRAYGVKDVRIKTFRGIYNGERYPESYQNGDIILIKKLGLDDIELSIASNKVNFFGNLCTYGFKDIVMDISGNLTRCNTSRKYYGNLFSGKYHFDDSPNPCPFIKCECPYQGIRSAKNEKRFNFALLREIIAEYALKHNRINIIKKFK